MNTLHTERLILRPFTENDAAAMFRNWTSDERVARHCRWHAHKDISETEQYLQMCLKAEYSWAITLKEKDEPIGCIDVVGENSAGVPEIGYVLAHEHWRKGYMTETVKAVIDELFRCGFEKIGACHDVNNPASGRVMQKAGMIYVRNEKAQKKFGSDEQCEVRCYEIEKSAVKRTDCCFCVGKDWFRYRVGAIIVSEGYALFAYGEDSGYYYTVGGGVHIGEHSEDAILREVCEETGEAFQIERPLCIVENFFKDDLGGKELLDCHTIEFYYLMKPTQKREYDVVSITTGGQSEKMRWIPLESIDEYDIRPEIVKHIVKEMPQNFTAYVNDECGAREK